MDKEELERQLAIMNGEIEPEGSSELDELMDILNGSDDDILNLDSMYSSDENTEDNFNGLSNEDLKLLSNNEEENKVTLTNAELEELLNSYEDEPINNNIEITQDMLNSIMEDADNEANQDVNITQDMLNSIMEDADNEDISKEQELSQEELNNMMQNANDDNPTETDSLSQDMLDSLISEDDSSSDNSTLSQEELDNMMQNANDDNPTETDLLSQDMLDALMNDEASSSDNSTLSQEELDNMIQNANDDNPTETDLLSQDMLDALMNDEASSSDDGLLSQDALNSLMAEDENVNEPTPEVVAEENKDSIKEDKGNNMEEEKEVKEDIKEEAVGMEEFFKFVDESKNRYRYVPEEPQSKKPMIIMISVIVFLIVLIVLTIVFFTISITKINKINQEKAIASDNNIAKYVPEDENVVYLDMAKEIDGQSLILEKAHLNLNETTLYFKNKINTRKYDITLTDNSGNLYPMDIDFTRDGFNENSTILKFAPLKDEIENLVLKIESLETGEKTEFNLVFDATIVPNPIRYINSSIVNKFDGFSVNINNAIFTDNSTKIDYTIVPNADTTYKIQQGSANQQDFVKLKQDEVAIAPTGYKPVTTIIDNTLIGSMEFETVPNQSGNVVLELNDIYKKYDINKILSQDEVNSGKIVYDFDNYKVFIEGIKLFGDKYVLVAHAENKNVSTENRSENVSHTELSLDVELIAQNSNGSEIIISPTQVISADIGTDMLFELDSNQMQAIAGKNVSVNLKSALIKVNPVQIPLSLERCMTRPIIGQEIMQQQIKEAFVSRLAYKLDGKDLSKVVGFSEDILNNPTIMGEYAPMGKMTNPKYDLQFVSTNLNENSLQAIVQEVYQYEFDGDIKTFYVKHKIKGSYVEGNWTITYDEIIR